MRDGLVDHFRDPSFQVASSYGRSSGQSTNGGYDPSVASPKQLPHNEVSLGELAHESSWMVGNSEVTAVRETTGVKSQV
jgi:hypothetical protein